MAQTYTVVRQDWLEHERGWGCRPDGYTLHLTDADRQAFIEAYWARMPDQVPDEYSAPEGVLSIVDVNEATYQKLLEQKENLKPLGISRYGLWF